MKWEDYYAAVEQRAEKAAPEIAGPHTTKLTIEHKATITFMYKARTDIPALVARCRVLEEALRFVLDSDISGGRRMEKARAILAAPAPGGNE